MSVSEQEPDCSEQPTAGAFEKGQGERLPCARPRQARLPPPPRRPATPQPSPPTPHPRLPTRSHPRAPQAGTAASLGRVTRTGRRRHTAATAAARVVGESWPLQGNFHSQLSGRGREIKPIYCTFLASFSAFPAASPHPLPIYLSYWFYKPRGWRGGGGREEEGAFFSLLSAPSAPSA